MAKPCRGLPCVDIVFIYVVLAVHYEPETAITIIREIDVDARDGYVPGQEQQQQKKQHNIPDRGRPFASLIYVRLCSARSAQAEDPGQPRPQE